jgi:lipopolysaccharide/colanic/teichoic acid biosynthesis glycosyltransferase
MRRAELNNPAPRLLLFQHDAVHNITFRRLIDIFVAANVLIFSSPLMLLIAFMIWLTSEDTVFVVEKRIGRCLKVGSGDPTSRMAVFEMYRFRTTHVSTTVTPRLSDDKQITHLGRFLQKTSLDELPQFINVLKGDMSLIGPRPIHADTLERDYEAAYEERFSVRPAITGLWQVKRDHIGTFREMAAVDIQYIHERSLSLDLWILAMTFVAVVKRSNIQHWVNRSIVKVRENPVYNLIKRIMDILLASVALIVFSPLMLLVAIAVWLDSPGPIIYVQKRAGKRVILISQGKPLLVTTNFKFYKFRSMYHKPIDNELAHKQWIEAWINGKLNTTNNPQEVVKPKNDPRVTRVGRFLRATSLDELPQLINILKGDMSLVGPRPVPVYEVETYSESHLARLDAIPGLTGWWQVNLRGRGTLDQMVELDREYISKRSLWMDIKILILTIPAVVFGRGAK